MKTIKIIIVLFLAFQGSNVFSQKIIMGNDTSNVYLAILNKIDLVEKKAFVIKETNFNDIKSFKFDHIESYLLGAKGFELYRDSCWKSFLFSIDTGQIKNHKIYIAPVPNNVIFIKEGEKDFSKMLVDPINIYGIVSFSPIILSSDKKKAFIISKNLRPSSGRSRSAVFLAKYDDVWEVERTILLEIQ